MSNTDEKMPLCAVHDQLDRTGDLILTYGNSCVACSLNEHQELLNLIAEHINPFADSVTCLRQLLTTRFPYPTCRHCGHGNKQHGPVTDIDTNSNETMRDACRYCECENFDTTHLS